MERLNRKRIQLKLSGGSLEAVLPHRNHVQTGDLLGQLRVTLQLV